MSLKFFTLAFIIIIINEIEATIYDPTQDIFYTYGSADQFGPSNWPGVCLSGTIQSPIEDNLSTNNNVPLPKLQFFGNIKAPAQEIQVVNNGFGVFFKFNYHPLNAPKIYGGPLRSFLYQFAGFSYHVKEEHTSFWNPNNSNSDLELEFIHFNLKYGSLENARDKSDGLAVISVRYKIDPALTASLFPVPLLSLIGSVHFPFTEVTQSPASFGYASVLGFATIPRHYSARGSLTTPPCHQSVQWFVVEEVRKLYAPDLNAFKNIRLWDSTLLSANNRPTQPINGRSITRYFP